MPYKDPEMAIESRRKYRKYNRDKVVNHHRIYNIENREVINQRKRYKRRTERFLWGSFLRDTGMGECSICGYSRCQAAIEFHHRDPTQKEKGISQIIQGRRYNAENVLEFLVEADKCDVVCANCHREIHNNQLIKEIELWVKQE